MPIKFEEDADDNKFYASFGIPISQVKLAVDSEHVHIPDTKPPQFWPDYLSFEYCGNNSGRGFVGKSTGSY